MPFAEIEKRILEEAQGEAAEIKKRAEQSAAQAEKAHALRKDELRAASSRAARNRAEEVRRAILIPARLKAKKELLEEKQKLLGRIYSEIKKDKKLTAAEAARLREETEIKAAGILFGE